MSQYFNWKKKIEKAFPLNVQGKECKLRAQTNFSLSFRMSGCKTIIRSRSMGHVGWRVHRSPSGGPRNATKFRRVTRYRCVFAGIPSLSPTPATLPEYWFESAVDSINRLSQYARFLPYCLFIFILRIKSSSFAWSLEKCKFAKQQEPVEILKFTISPIQLQEQHHDWLNVWIRK